MLGAPSRTKPGIPSRGSAGPSVFTHEPLLVRNYRGCERHRSGRTVDTLEASGQICGLLAHMDAGNVTGLGNAQVATYGVGGIGADGRVALAQLAQNRYAQLVESMR
jgi:hypothetical protein